MKQATVGVRHIVLREMQPAAETKEPSAAKKKNHLTQRRKDAKELIGYCGDISFQRAFAFCGGDGSSTSFWQLCVKKERSRAKAQRRKENYRILRGYIISESVCLLRRRGQLYLILATLCKEKSASRKDAKEITPIFQSGLKKVTG